MPNLGLNEALLVINRGNITGQLQLFYQLEECFGCPLTPLKPLDDKTDQYVVDTRHDLQLELRQLNLNSTGGSCSLDEVALNSQGQYRIDVGQLEEGGQLFCKLKTLDYGECLLCPFAILVCFLFAITALEQAYTKIWLVGRRSRRASTSGGGVGGGGSVARGQETGLQVETTDGGIDDLDGGGEPVAPAEADQQRLAATDQGSSGSERRPSIGHPVAASSPTTSKTTVVFNEPPLPPPLSSVVAGLKTSSTTTPSRRVECLDIFRGSTLAGMIFVNYGGAGYAIWEHTPWDGIKPADLVFPFFIFSMGASVAISVRSLVKRQRGSFKAVAMKIARRATVLMLLGIFLNSRAINYEQSDGLTRLRLTGVLQRFAISYLVIAFMYTIELTLSKWARAQSLSNVPYLSKCVGIIFEVLTAINYMAIYVYVTFYLDYDSSGNCPIGYTGPGGQTAGGQYATCTGGSAAWLDRLLLGESHLYNDHEVKQIFGTRVTHDPEGILGYTTSIVLTLIGLQCGKILAGKRAPRQKLLALAKWVLALALSCSLVMVIPINKRLWSLTFVLVSALAAFLINMAFYILIDVYSCKRALIIRLLSSAGKNSIFLYVAHSLIYNMLPWWFPVGDQTSHMQLLFRLTWATLVWLLIAHYMAYKRLFIKV